MKTHSNEYKWAFPLSVLILLTAWEMLPKWFSIPSYVFPTLSTIVENTVMAKNSLMLLHLGTTTLEAILGFLLGSLIAFLIGVLMEEFQLFAKITLPYVIASNAIPVIALAPILILWFGNGIMSKVVVAAFLCFFPLCINTYKGLSEYKNSFKHLFDVYGASSQDFLIRFKLPNAIPYIITGLKLNAVYSVIGAIVAEFIGSDSGLGFGMLQASYNLNIPRLWGYIIVSCLLGLSFYVTILIVERLIVRKFHFLQ